MAWHLTQNMEDKIMNIDELLQKETNIVQALRNVYDPEIPVNIYDLGLIYEIDVKEDGHADIQMTLTAPACPAADFILEEVNEKVLEVDGITGVNVELTFDPPWDKDLMSEEAKLELGML